MAANVIMVVLLAVLTALTAALLLLEIRQSAARKLLITMAKRLERMERHMGAAKNETDVPEDDGKKKGAESPAGRGKENCDPSFLPFRGIGGKKTAAPTGGRVTWEELAGFGQPKLVWRRKDRACGHKTCFCDRTEGQRRQLL